MLFEEWRETLSDRYLLAPIGLLGLAVWVVCAILLALAWRRRRRQNRVRMAQWEREERAYDEMIARLEAERAAMQREDEPPLLN